MVRKTPNSKANMQNPEYTLDNNARHAVRDSVITKNNSVISQEGVSRKHAVREQDPDYKKGIRSEMTCISLLPACPDPEFKRPRMLKEHMQRLHRLSVDFACNPCGEAFELSGDLNRH